ncbi:hypothetical protein M9458_030519, partial [Cirrhinus mrigala]
RARKPPLESAAVIPAGQRNGNWRRHYICPAHRETLHSHRARPQSATLDSTHTQTQAASRLGSNSPAFR